jgi:hypothetical protein
MEIPNPFGGPGRAITLRCAMPQGRCDFLNDWESMKTMFDEDERRFNRDRSLIRMQFCFRSRRSGHGIRKVKKPSIRGGLLYRTGAAGEIAGKLLRRRRREDLAPAGLWFRFGFRRFLGFFSTFVFASHDKKHDTNRGGRKGGIEGGELCALSDKAPAFCRFYFFSSVLAAGLAR